MMQCELGLSVKPFVRSAQDIEDDFGQMIYYPDGSLEVSEYYIDCIIGYQFMAGKKQAIN